MSVTMAVAAGLLLSLLDLLFNNFLDFRNVYESKSFHQPDPFNSKEQVLSLILQSDSLKRYETDNIHLELPLQIVDRNLRHVPDGISWVFRLILYKKVQNTIYQEHDFKEITKFNCYSLVYVLVEPECGYIRIDVARYQTQHCDENLEDLIKGIWLRNYDEIWESFLNLTLHFLWCHFLQISQLFCYFRHFINLFCFFNILIYFIRKLKLQIQESNLFLLFSKNRGCAFQLDAWPKLYFLLSLPGDGHNVRHIRSFRLITVFSRIFDLLMDLFPFGLLLKFE